MNDARLVLPSIEFKRSFIEAVHEFRADSYPFNVGGMGRYKDVQVEPLEADFDSYLRQLRELAEGKDLKPGIVRESTFWLVDEGEFVGRLSLRDVLNEKLMRTGGHIGYEIRPSRRRQGYGTVALALGLAKARELGIAKVLLTCDSINTPSRRIIERNGGVFEDEVQYDPGKPPKQRFWIDLAADDGAPGR